MLLAAQSLARCAGRAVLTTRTRRATTMANATRLAYFDHTYVFKTGATVVGVQRDEGNEPARQAVLLDETIFYPFGGGQPNDTGVIEGNGASFTVEDVRLKEGVVHHFGSFSAGSAEAFAPGTAVSLSIDEARRRLLARVHSAGHLLDVCMARIGLGPDKLVPAKGQHHADAAYVEYKGKASAAELASLQGALQAQIDAAIAAGSKVDASVVPYDAAAALCGGDLPPYIARDSAPRVVVMVPGTVGCPCGGTHVADVAEIGPMKITGVRVKKGITRVSYTIDGMTAGAEAAD